jgi:uncharacterized cupredoxin-like copper-binding protein
MKKQSLVFTFLLSIFMLSAFMAFSYAQTSKTIYSGEVSTSTYGFGNSASSISSPGPTLTFTAGESVTMTLQNAGTMQHDWAIVSTKSSTGTVLWGAQIGSASNPVAAGGSGSVTFTVGSAGDYYYVCQVDGHVALGMWGNVHVNGAVPEFPTPLLIIFMAAAITAMAAYIGRINTKHVKPF